MSNRGASNAGYSIELEGDGVWRLKSYTDCYSNAGEAIELEPHRERQSLEGGGVS